MGADASSANNLAGLIWAWKIGSLEEGYQGSGFGVAAVSVPDTSVLEGRPAEPGGVHFRQLSKG